MDYTNNIFSRDNYPEGVPVELVAGDYWTWKQSDVGKYYNIGAGGTHTVNYSLVKDDGAKDFSITPNVDVSTLVMYVEHGNSLTQVYPKGLYYWELHLTEISSGNSFAIERGTVSVKANIRSPYASNVDQRSHVKRTLDAIEATLEGRATSDQLLHDIDGVSIQRMKPADLLVMYEKYKGYYRNELRSEKLKNGENVGGKILVRFKNG